MTLKNVKVTENVKKQLDDLALEKETYNVTIQRLINENKSLRKSEERNEKLIKFYKKLEVQYDKANVDVEMLSLIMEKNHIESNYALDELDNINRVLLSDITKEEMFEQLKDVIDNTDFNKKQMLVLINYAKNHALDDFDVLPDIENEIKHN